MKTQELSFDTSTRRFVDLTDDVNKFVAGEGDGLVHVFLPHATAGLALIELGSGSEADLEEAISRLLPRDHAYVHHHGSPGHGADHVLPAFLAPSLTLPVVDGQVVLGTWQSVVMIDLNRDNPNRHVRLSFLSG
ncbi:MAG TPA: secondary thiamine-phosphate synthase enzyme YjbQ [Actinomycetota bacterium]|nr:secondary thiamine-phosphate synthase enzyme YjbQ [Actinomycetota bacterium]